MYDNFSGAYLSNIKPTCKTSLLVNRIAETTIPCVGYIFHNSYYNSSSINLVNRCSVVGISGPSSAQLNSQVTEIGEQTVVVLAEVDICLQGKMHLMHITKIEISHTVKSVV